jgi:hypothetical protein
VPLVHVVAVAAAAVELAEVLDVEVGNGDGAGTVVLDDLVVSAKGAAALDVGRVAAVLGLDGEGVLTDRRPPDVADEAGALAL